MEEGYLGSAETNVDHYSDVRDLEDLHFLHSSAMDLRNERWDHERLEWAKHVEHLQHEDRFATEYLMKLQTYNKLIRILDPILERVEFNSRCSEPIQVEHIIAHGIRVLCGGTQSNNHHLVGSSIAAAYAAFDDFIDAVNYASALDIIAPQTEEGWLCINAEWKKKSSNEIIAGCVTAFDGFFQRCNKPTKKETRNTLAYYSGHYESYGVNCQACVRADLCFIYFGVVAPGSTNDNIAFLLAPGLKDLFDSLPLGARSLRCW